MTFCWFYYKLLLVFGVTIFLLGVFLFTIRPAIIISNLFIICLISNLYRNGQYLLLNSRHLLCNDPLLVVF